MMINQSSGFWYKFFFGNISLEIFRNVPVLETIRSTYTQEANPCTSLDENIFAFEFERDHNLYLELFCNI